MAKSEQADPYLKKRVSLESHGQRLEFDVAHTLFASHEIDLGTRLLLRSIEVAHPPQRVLDLGCGYGVLGIALAHRFPEAAVVLADSDLLAVRYARANAVLNGTRNAKAIGSVALEAVSPGQFDLIVSNVPAKVGDRAIEEEFVLAPRTRLAPGGAYWFVVVSGLNQLTKRIASRNELPLRQVRKRSGHTVYRLPAASAT